MAYFSEGAKILTFSTDLGEKQQIEYGLNRNIVPLNTFEDMLSEIEYGIQKNGKIYIIITKNMSPIFKSVINDIIDILEMYAQEDIIEVFDIGTDGMSEHFKRFGTILDFIEHIRLLDRDDYISKKENGTQKENDDAKVLRELMSDLASSKELLSITEEKLNSVKNSLESALAENVTLKSNIDTLYVGKIDRLENTLAEKSNEINNLTKLVEIRDKKIKEYEADVSNVRTDNSELRLTVETLEVYRESLLSENKQLRNSIKRLTIEIDKLNAEKNQILSSSVDQENFVILNNQLAEERKKYNKLQDAYDKLEIEIRTKNFKIQDLLREIDEIRKGDEQLEKFGRSQYIDKYKFNNLDIVYIKVIDDLPYTTKLLHKLYREIKKKYPKTSRTHAIIIRNDDGLDNAIYKDVSIYGTLEHIPFSEEIFRLYPSRKMFTGAEQFENNTEFIMVVDYIRDTNYLLDSDGKINYLTMIKQSKLIRDYGLKGSPICLGTESILNVMYSKSIASSQVRENKEMFLDRRVTDCITRLRL